MECGILGFRLSSEFCDQAFFFSFSIVKGFMLKIRSLGLVLSLHVGILGLVCVSSLSYLFSVIYFFSYSFLFPLWCVLFYHAFE